MNTRIQKLFIALAWLALPALVQAQTIVTNLADSGPGTLRSALNAASGAVITFDPSLSGATITLNSTLTINTNLAIDASALPGGLQINGNGSVQIFMVASNTIVFLNSLTITNGSGFYGGGIQNNGTLTLTDCTLSGNSAVQGAGIFNGGTLMLNQCTLSGNIANNIFYPEGPEAFGGGIYNGGTLTLNQCTVSGNTAGGYYAEGGGIYGNSLAITNTIVAGNFSHYGENIFSGTLICGGSNLVQAAVFHLLIGPAPLTKAPNLAPLGNYGGPTQTMPPLPGSPAIGAGSVADNTFSTDQRGYPRTQNGLIDLGAVELQVAMVTNLNDSGVGSLRAALGAPSDLIGFAANLAGETNILTSGELLIPTNLTIDASALPGGFKISGNTNSRVFEMAANTVVTLNSLTIQDGNIDGNGGGIYVNPGASLTLTNCTLSGNSATNAGGPLVLGSGGGIYVDSGASLTLNNCILSDNSSYEVESTSEYVFSGGGGIYFNGGSLTVNGSTFTNNGASELNSYYNAPGGGGIYFSGGTLTVNGSTFSGNSTRSDYGNDFGGGILVYGGTATVSESIFSGNFSAYGSGICDWSNASFTVNGSMFTNNFGAEGGGIYFGVGTLMVNGSTFFFNYAGGVFGGGGICAREGTLTVNNSTFCGNYGIGIGGGGGIYDESLSILTINDSTFSGNNGGAKGGGGICMNGGPLTVNGSTFSGNQDNGDGGGIFVGGGASTINGSTFSTNSAREGGGIYFFGTLTINNSTICANSANYGGGIYDAGGTNTINDSTFSGNTNYGIFSGDVSSFFYLTNTIVADTPGITLLGVNNLTNSNPLLAPLGNYGGPTQTMPPLPGSPAIGAGSVADNTFSTDQRGYPRTQNGLIDIGAVELQSPAANPPVLGNITVPAGGGNGLQFTFTNAPAADFTVLTATNVSLAMTNWTVLGEVQQVAPGQYQFTDLQAATNRVRFYRVQSP